MSASRQVKIFLDGKQVEATLGNVYRLKRKVNGQILGMVEGTDEYNEKIKELKSLNGIIDRHRQNLRGTRNTIGLMQGSLVKYVGVAAGAFTVNEILRYGKELGKLGTQMQVMERKARTVFGETLPQVSRAARQNANDMGLSIGQYIDASAAIGDLLIPMKFSRQEAADMSTTLVDLSGALSEWTGGQRTAEEVTDILGKAILGEREQLKTLGISIQEADVQNRLREKGLQNLTGEYLQQAKAIATLELITEKSVDAQNAYITNTDSAIRSQAQLTAAFQEIKEKLATVLLPIFSRLVGVAATVVDGISSIADGINKMINPTDAATQAFKEQRDQVLHLHRDISPLLDRYDELTTKGNLSTEEQEDLNEILSRIQETIPGAVTQVDKYGNALEINTGKAREFVTVQEALLRSLNQDAIKEVEKDLKKLNREYELLEGTLNRTGGGFGNVVVQNGELFKRVIKGNRDELRKLSQEEVADLQGRMPVLTQQIKDLNVELGNLTGTPFFTPEEIEAQQREAARKAEEETKKQAQLAAQNKAERAKKEREAQLKREEAALKRRAERLNQITSQLQEEERLSRLSEDDRKLEELRLRYQKEIDLAKELEAKGIEEASTRRIELERLRDEALTQFQIERAQEQFAKDEAARIEKEQKELQDLDEFERRKAEVNQRINEEVRAVVFDERALAFLELSEHYESLKELARQYGIDTLDIDIAFRRDRERLEQEFQERSERNAAESAQKKAEAYAKMFAGYSSVVQGFIAVVGDESAEFAGLQKILTLAQIAFDTAKAISALTAAAQQNPANAVTFGAAGVAQFATGLAQILSNIAQAKAVLSEAPPVPQRYSGGYFDVRGQDDGRNYRARFNGLTETGMLPNFPVLLASERGQEFLVSHPELQNPEVIQHVRAIQNIKRYGSNVAVPQFVNGGFFDASNTQTASASPGPAIPQQQSSDPAMMATLGQLANILSEIQLNGIEAFITDDTIREIMRRTQKITIASGGSF